MTQTYTNVDILAINDASTDSSLAILEDYAARYPQITVETIPHGGLGAARNRGLELAKGDFVFFIDSDDWLAPEAMEKLLAYAERQGSDFVCYGGRKVIDETREELPFKAYTADVWEGNDTVLAKSAPLIESACFKFYRRSFIEEYGLRFVPGHFYEDVSFHWKCLGCAKHVTVISECFYYYRIRQNSIMGGSVAKQPGRAIHHLYELEELHRYWCEHGILEKHRDLFTAIVERYIEAGYKFLPDEDKPAYVAKVKALVTNFGVTPHRFTMLADLVKGKALHPHLYKWRRSVLRRLGRWS